MAKSSPAPIPAFLVLGSFPLTNRAPGHWLEGAMACEGDFAPGAGDPFNGREWFRTDTRDGMVDFLSGGLKLEQRTYASVYCATYIKSPTAKAVRLLLGSDDGAAVWLNNREVHRVDMQRGLVTDQDDIPLKLRAGWNLLLIKVAQGEGGWALSARLASRTGGDPGVKFDLKCPKGTFKGLKGRKEGLKTGGVAPTVDIAMDKGRINLTLGLWLFNDNDNKTNDIELSLATKSGKVLATSKDKSLPPFGGARRILNLSAEQLADAIAAGARVLRASCNAGEISEALPPDLLPQVFVCLVSGFPIKFGEKNGVFSVPEALKGQAALLETYLPNPNALTREVSWPVLPKREVSAKETKSGTVKIDIEPPKGMPHVAGRIVFGDEEMLDVISRVRFMTSEMGAGLGAFTESGAAGIQAFLKGDTAKVRKALDEIYKGLAAQQPDRSNEKVILVGHAHIDMNWLWNNWETFLCCHDTFRQVLAFMEEFPEFTFSQSQTSTYKMIRDHDPVMFEQIRELVKQGRWELIGGEIDEGDTNLSSGEGICRSLLLGQRFFQTEFGKRAQVGWLPDNFGHVAQLPQIMNLAGIRFFYGHRCQPCQGPYTWEGADGSKVMVFATPTYNGDVNPHIRKYPEIYNNKHRTAMWVYGVGDHGGGPSRQDITRAMAYREIPGFPKIEFGTATAFYEELEKNRKDFPQHKGELQYIFEGCYTSIARVKLANRKGENTLYAAELYSTLGMLDGDPYPQDRLNDSWEILCFNQFHDILCGSAINESNQESLATYYDAISRSKYVLYESLRRLASRVDTRGGKAGGQPLVVFNPLAQEATDYVEAEVFAYQPPPSANLNHWGEFTPRPVTAVDVGQGPYASMKMEDEKGRSIPAQIVGGKLFPNGYRVRVRFLAKDIPAGGWRTYYAYPAETGAGADDGLVVKGTTIETKTLKVTVDGNTGLVTRIFDKEQNRELVAKGAGVNLLKVYMEAPHGMSAWNIGEITRVYELTEAKSVRVVELGPVRAVIEVDHEWNRSSFTQRIIVYRDVKRVDFELDARWFEVAGPNVDMPMLRVSFPLAIRKGAFNCETPFAVCERPTDGREVPAQKWVDLSDEKGGAAILSDSKYGYRCDGNTPEMTLLRASYDPDRYPDLGPHQIRYSLVPHTGDWKKAGLDVEGLLFNTRLQSIETPPSAGDRPASGSFIELSPEHLHLSAVKKAEDGNAVIVRFHEGHGKKTNATLTLPRQALAVARVNVLEETLPDASPATVNGNKITLAVKAHEIVTLKITL